MSMDLKTLCDDHYREGITGAISFSSPFYKLLCKELKINYKQLSRLGRAVLKADAIDTLNGKDEHFKNSEYYLGL